MLKKFTSLLATCMVIFSLSGVQMPVEATASSQIEKLDQSIQRIVKDEIENADVSIAIRDEEGRIIYDLNGNRKQKPASNMKLLTSAAALEELGEDYRFQTNIYTTGNVKKGILYGDLYLQGTGDPTLTIKDFDQFAHFLAQSGLKKIKGRIVADDYWFDQDLLTPDIQKDDESYYYAAPVTALTMSPDNDYDAGSIIVEAIGKKTGEKPYMKITPELGELIIENKAKTVGSDEYRTIKIEREYRTNKIVVSGNLPLGQNWREWITVQNPTKHTMTLWKHSLKKNNIQYRKDQFYREKTPKNARLMIQKQSIPLAELMIPYMKLSNNSIANILVKTMGKLRMGQGSTKAGLSVLKQYAFSRQLDIDHWLFEDGSGMSHHNRVSSVLLTQLLYSIQAEKQWYGTFFNSLPVAGYSDRMIGGSLKNRLKTSITKGKVFAKTGAIDGVNTLSGYLIGNSGKMYIFSVLVQNQKNTIPTIDEIVEVMVEKL